MEAIETRPLAANWIDIELGGKENSKRSAGEILRSASVPEAFVEAALADGTLPRFESEGDSHFLLLRVFDEAAGRRAENARALSRKLAVVITGNKAFSLHRFPTPEIPKIFTPKNGPVCDVTLPMSAESILELMIDRSTLTFTEAIARSEDVADAMESMIFNAPRGKPFHLKDAYLLKRRLSVQKRMLEMNRDAFESASRVFPALAKAPVKRRIARSIGLADSLVEDLNHILQLHLSLLSQKTNEVMRVLTVFSAFFLPLSFIAGVYGMNFEGMPELKHPYGYAGSIAVMATVAFTIFTWFRKRGWIGKPKA